MAYEIPGFSFTLPASTGVLNTQFRMVTINASGEAAFPAAGAAIVGCMTNKPTLSGQAATIVNDGIVKIEAAGSTVATGDLVAASSIGRVILGTTNNTIVGRVVSGSSGSTGRILSVLLSGGQDVNP